MRFKKGEIDIDLLIWIGIGLLILVVVGVVIFLLKNSSSGIFDSIKNVFRFGA